MAAPTRATIFAYCERGNDPSFWGEPLNAITNGGFIIAALAGIVMLARMRPQSRLPWHYFFILNFIAIGIGSFLFHTYANAWSAAADTIPIGIFMLAYLMFAMRRYLGLSWFWTAAAVAVFIAAVNIAMNVQCWQGRFGFLENVPPGARARCLNGSLGYFPAMLTMWLVGFILLLRRHPAGGLILSAGVVFAASLTFRSVDFTFCNDFILFGYRAGTHFLWHLLNSLTLFLLLLGAIRYGVWPRNVVLPKPAHRDARADVRASLRS
jgi:hypothetical protein